MSDRKLTCSARGCAHNYDGECNAGYINVRGSSAVTTSETTCSSFFDDSIGLFTSAITCGNKIDPDDIICEALNCIYNKGKSCLADNVHINSNFSSCETFKCK
ncbi:DUF1540 domain-containing protein [Terrisporobacter sp.]|uniref:DUF1540 domain-containing protein n=1 Tax=Terrisporobacter sp. TaxID=1965305 RepID=UPI00263951D4|nr:DUF1540 domain-containing protein [Terrisporobacter sp.]